MKNLSRILSIVGFSILSGLFGIGVTWLLLAFLYVRNNDERLTKIMPLLLVGGIVGLIIGIIVALRVAKASPETETAIENKYVGAGGHGRIYAGAPMSIMAFLMFFYGEKFLNKFGNATGAYLGLGIFFVILVAGLILRDHLPPKLLIPIGIIGWLLTLSLFIWFGFFSPAAFGN
jgi:hypothetical protein